jgi:hypothetical protein
MRHANAHRAKAPLGRRARLRAQKDKMDLLIQVRTIVIATVKIGLTNIN